jgi:hypothetical protein
VTLVLDAGALIALERNERAMWTRLKDSLVARERPVTHAGVVGQVWRGGPWQARLSQALAGVNIRSLDEGLGRRAGELLGAASLSDVVDAGVALLSNDGDEIVTLDIDDLSILVTALGRHVEIVRP